MNTTRSTIRAAAAALVLLLGARTGLSQDPSRARVSVHVIDGAGQKVTPDFDVRSEAGESLGTGSEKSRWAQVPAGVVWIAPRGMPDLIRKTTVAQGQELDLELSVPGSMWLRFLQGKQWLRRLVPLKEASRRRELVGRIRTGSHQPYYHRSLRPDASKDQVEAGLALARRELAARASLPTFPAGTSEPEKALRLMQYRATLRYISQLLSSLGDASDAKRLMSTAPGGDEFLWERASYAAYLEARLGCLERGEVAAAAAKGDLFAVIVLREYGLAIGSDLLRRALAGPEGNPDYRMIGFSLLEDDDPATLNAMRKVWEATSDDLWASLPIALYLLAYGTSEDLRLVGSRAITAPDARWLMGLVEDPMAILDLPDWYAMARALPSLTDLGPERAKAVVEAFDRAIPVQNDRNSFHAYAGNFQPHSDIAECYFNEKVSMDDLFWAPAVWKKDEILQALVVARDLAISWEDHLDVLPAEQLSRDFEALNATSRMGTVADLFLARHRLTTRASAPMISDWADGVERRPFAFRSRPEEGAVSGLLEIRPRLVEGTLRLSLKFKTKPYYYVAGIRPMNGGKVENWSLHKYVVNSGRAYVGGLSLRRNGAGIAVVDRGVLGDGTLCYEAKLGGGDLSGLVLDLDLEFLGEHRRVVMDLFSGETARAARRGGRTPQALERQGRLNDAWELLRKDPARKLSGVDLFSAAGAHDRAAAAIADLLRDGGKDAGLAADRVTELYLAGAYADAAAAASEALALAPSDDDLRVMRAICLLLSGDVAAAGEILASVPEGVQPARVLPLAVACAAKGGARDKAIAALRRFHESAKDPSKQPTGAALDGQTPPTLDPAFDYALQCKRLLFAGYYELLVGGSLDRARQRWSEAVKTRLTDLPEYRLAQAALDGRGPR